MMIAASGWYQYRIGSYRRCRQLIFIILLLGFVYALSNPLPASAMSSTVLIDLTNQKRQELGLSPLHYSAALAASASAKAADMLANNYWSHVSPAGVQPWYFMDESHYSYVTAGENLAKDFDSESSVVDAWMNSPSHRANIVNSAFEDMGIAVVPGQLLGASTILIVVHYGATAHAAAAPAAAAAYTPEPEQHITFTHLLLGVFNKFADMNGLYIALFKSG